MRRVTGMKPVQISNWLYNHKDKVEEYNAKR